MCDLARELLMQITNNQIIADRNSVTSLSAIKGVNQAFARFTPFFTPKNVKLGVFVFLKILQKNVNYKAIGISMDWQNEPL